MPTLLGHMPAGSSVRCLVHYAQGVNSGKFRKYDFGRTKNIEVYGTPDPPEYRVDRITAPVAFYWGENDWLGVKAVSHSLVGYVTFAPLFPNLNYFCSFQDTYRLAEQMPNLQRMFRVNHDKYNHLDFLWATDNLELINRQTIEFMKNF